MLETLAKLPNRKHEKLMYTWGSIDKLHETGNNRTNGNEKR
jgi:hypothetical protein